MKTLFDKPKSLTEKSFHYCPGCTNGVIHRLVAEVIDLMDIRDKVIGVSPVGCAAFAYEYFNVDMQSASHGRAPAVATGIKRALPENLVFTYQGDGDMAAIGTSEIIHAAARGENITAILVNNAIFGMTGGQMAPTTLINQVSATTPNGRNIQEHGYPLNMSELIGSIQGATYVERVSVHDVKHIKKAKGAILKGFKRQKEKMGFSLIEILSTCPTNWKMTPEEALEWVGTELINQYPLGVVKEVI